MRGGYYHSRIKYPNQKDPDEKKPAEKSSEEKTPEQENIAAPEKETEKKAVQQGTPAVKGISPEVKNYLQIDLGITTTEQSVEKDSPDGNRKKDG